MNICGIICEYNPFHNGHAYMLRELKEVHNIDYVVCFMSGNYVQRGEPAVMDKYRRTEHALLGGADLVLEMPAEFSSSSAGDFAGCGISMLISTGICTHLAFGIEPDITIEEINQYRKQAFDNTDIREKLKNGCTYPEAVFGKKNILGPNSILACEYLNALDKMDPFRKINVIPVKRSGDAYHKQLPSGEGFASATSIRKLLQNNKGSELDSYIPYSVEREIFCFPDMLSDILNDRLLRENDYEVYADVSREIADRLRKQKYMPCTFEERVDAVKTRQYTRTRISRALLHIILGIRKERVEELKKNGYCPYFRVLGYRQESSLLQMIGKESCIPIYTKNSKFYEAFPDSLYYDQIWHNTTGTGTELTRTPIIL